MATAALIPVEEYLATSYRPDRDYIDGEVRERTLGETEHSGLQAFFTFVFLRNLDSWNMTPFPERRVQVSASRFRVPDVSVVRPSATPPGGILRQAPFLCIEILSPGDSLSEMQERVDDYLNMGVGHIWLVDPVRRLFWTADDTGMHPLRTSAYTIPDSPVRIELSELNAYLDRIIAG